jgi:enoyl-CoA hydratase
LAVAACISAANSAADGTKNGYAIEVAAFGDCFATEDKVEGTQAFLQKRKAIFSGR